MPRVSVITPVRDGESFLGEAIGSVLSQTFGDFEYIVVDDASTDRTPDIIGRFARMDPRLVPCRNASSLRHSGSLNRALALARGEFVAILDADDIAMPERLERQVAYLDAHPEVGAVGAQVVLVDAGGNRLQEMDFPTTPALARWRILYGTPLLHSAATMRRALVEQVGGYSVHHRYATDFELFSRLVEVTRLANLPEFLVAYRRNPGQISAVSWRPQLGEVVLLIHAMLAGRLGLRVGLDGIALLFRAVRGGELPDEKALLGTAELLGRIHARYEDVEPLDDERRQAVRQSCAWLWVVMAYTHRRGHREASQRILRRARGLDPGLWRRQGTGEKLRKLRNSSAARRAKAGSPPVASPEG